MLYLLCVIMYIYIYCSLRPNTKYSFRVAATNDVGTSEFSPPSDEVKTREDGMCYFNLHYYHHTF